MTDEQMTGRIEAGAKATFESFSSLYRDVGGWNGKPINEWNQLSPEVRSQWRAHFRAGLAAVAAFIMQTPYAAPPPEALIAQADVKP
jgi:hypothetical protein